MWEMSAQLPQASHHFHFKISVSSVQCSVSSVPSLPLQEMHVALFKILASLELEGLYLKTVQKACKMPILKSINGLEGHYLYRGKNPGGKNSHTSPCMSSETCISACMCACMCSQTHICALVYTTKLVCSPTLVCVLVCAPKLVYALVCALKKMV